MNESIGWIDGEWGSINDLKLPLSDRGLKLADGIFETILILQGKTQLLSKHLNRWEQGALLLGMELPPKEDWLQPLINEAIQRASLTNKNGFLRLNWSRGDSINRGITTQSRSQNSSKSRFWLEINTVEPIFNPISVMISQTESRNSKSILSHCKTFAYGSAIQAQREAQNLNFDDALLLNSNGDLCCGTTANLIIRRKNTFLTPPLRNGCLAGTMRQQAIERMMMREEELDPYPKEGDQWLLINSLGCRPIQTFHTSKLDLFPNPKELWLSLLRE